MDYRLNAPARTLPLHRRSGIPQILCGGSGPLERTERTSCPAPSGVVRDQYGKRDEVGG